ncbi:LLM class flavin-dependent oxidoreductase [Labrys wisconsinensis]|uniref:Alkanesulfonate monooxygenase SsuD/methylene tetrahydromethanopterin reductase-like flavin-dependent oxidoreductase (Luciferase family) n=1 Tax=Labrys wisconsinensis TaxID=425677 RepID=A0ABU0JCW0_9HYPH|nr:LLM class flavin-dependent oxidoreductase [Labrys wisconsinensis]MDQ0472116.1 alkanesulfonate monooxygenase SsuD/methylene tetrahydromethanopterin reductase-like flavin-dependent oxidoreductase (luciferase family) [Labrys wisconsinensis]
MKLGLFNLMGLHDRNVSPISVMQTTIDAVKLADDFGFDVAWFAEHHFTNHSICPSSLLMIARCVAETRQIRLGSAVLVLPFYNPLRLVQEVAFAALVAGGRLVIGLGSGYQPYEFDRYRADIASKNEIMLEVWDLLEQGLTHGYVEHDGDHFQIEHTELPMRPLGFTLPEIFVAGSDPAVVARAAARGCTPFMSFGHRGLAAASAFRDRLAERWALGGGNPETMPLAVQRYIYITDDPTEAQHAALCVRDLARAAVNLNSLTPSKEGVFLRLMPLNDEPPLDDFMENAIIGPANQCAEKLQREIETLRPTHMSCFMGFAGIGRSQTLASMERFGYEVIPQLKGLVETRHAP